MLATRCLAPLIGAALAASALATTLVTQLPPTNGGTMRWSKLWIDPIGDNDSDNDAICWEDFVLSAPATLTHLEWWGSGAAELGFRIDFWRQDPGTAAYQPLAVFDVYGPDPSPVHPEARFTVTPAQYSATPGPGGLTHYVLELPTPVDLAANDASNPRWFVAVIARSANFSQQWSWAQGLGGSNRTYWWIRGAHMFYSLGEGRAMIIGGTVAAACPGDTNGDGVVDFADLNEVLSTFNLVAPGQPGDVNDDGRVDFADLNIVISAFNQPCP